MWVKYDGQDMIHGKEYFVLWREKTRLYLERTFWDDECRGFVKEVGNKKPLKRVEFFSREPEEFEAPAAPPSIPINKVDLMTLWFSLSLIGSAVFLFVTKGLYGLIDYLGGWQWLSLHW
jgi:hypothetical protein